MDTSSVWEDKRGRKRNFWDWADYYVGPGQAPRCVYIIGPLGGPYKIGVSNEPDYRLSQLGRPGDRVWGAVWTDNPFLVEASAHRALSGCGIGGEWFKCTLAEAVRAIEEAIEIVSTA